MSERITGTSRTVAWRKHEPSGMELAEISIEGETLLDCDLGLSPVTNMVPILRHGLLRSGRPVELTMAWVAVPALTVQPDGQRYRHLRRDRLPGHRAARMTAAVERSTRHPSQRRSRWSDRDADRQGWPASHGTR